MEFIQKRWASKTRHHPTIVAHDNDVDLALQAESLGVLSPG